MLILSILFIIPIYGEELSILIVNGIVTSPKLISKIEKRFFDAQIFHTLPEEDYFTNDLTVCFSNETFDDKCTWRIWTGVTGTQPVNADIVVITDTLRASAIKQGNSVIIEAGSASNKSILKPIKSVHSDDMCSPTNRPAILHLLFSDSELEFSFNGDNSLTSSPFCKVVIHKNVPDTAVEVGIMYRMMHNLMNAFGRLSPAIDERFRVVAFGDWGKPGKYMDAYWRGLSRRGGYFDAVWLLGDNFYPLGINRQLGSSDPSWAHFVNMVDILNGPKSRRDTQQEIADSEFFTSDLVFRSIASSDQQVVLPLLKFYVILGNHDYIGSAQAQIDYVHPQWVMPSRYYFKSFPGKVCVWFLDTDLGRFDSKQASWFAASVLTHKSACKWLIATGHHLVYSGADRKDNPALLLRLLPILQEHNFHMYLCGHEHQTQVLQDPAYRTIFVVAGASSEVVESTTSRVHPFLLYINTTKTTWLSLDFQSDRLNIRICKVNGSIVWEQSISSE